MQFIQDSITKVVMGIIGLKPEQVKQITECMSGKAEADSETAKTAGTETKEGAAHDEATSGKAKETQSEAQQLQQKTQQNINSANELLATVADLKKQLNKEIEQGAQYLNDVNAAVAVEKKQKEEKEKADEAKEAQGDKDKDKDKDGKKDDHGDAKKDQADPMQVARVKTAAQIVKESDSQNAIKLHNMLGAGRSTLGGGMPTANPEAVSEASSAFQGSGDDALSELQSGAQARAGKLDSITGNDQMTTAELGEAVGQVEAAAGDSDQAFEAAASQIESDYQQCYSALAKRPGSPMAAAAP